MIIPGMKPIKKTLLILLLPLVPIILLLTSCTTDGLSNRSERPEDTPVAAQESEDTPEEENTGTPEAAPQGGNSNETTGISQNNIMFQNTGANFAFVYPHGDLTLYSYPFWDPQYGGLSLFVDINDIDNMEGPVRDAAEHEREALQNGDLGEDTSFSLEQSRKVMQVGDVFVKEYVVFGRYDICDVTFERKAVFYNNNYQVRIPAHPDTYSGFIRTAFRQHADTLRMLEILQQ